MVLPSRIPTLTSPVLHALRAIPAPRDGHGVIGPKGGSMDTPCKLWEGYRDRWGYGRCYIAGKHLLAHRAAWVAVNGPIPEGMWVLHHCDTPACVEVGHLFLGDNTANVRDCVKKGRHKEAKKTHCPKGHPYSPENTLRGIRANGRVNRWCRTCNRMRSVRQWAAKKARMAAK